MCWGTFSRNTLNNKEFGGYYTFPEITEYLCNCIIEKLLLDCLASLPQGGKEVEPSLLLHY